MKIEKLSWSWGHLDICKTLKKTHKLVHYIWINYWKYVVIILIYLVHGIEYYFIIDFIQMRLLNSILLFHDFCFPDF